MNQPDYVDISMGGGGKRMDLLVKFITKHLHSGEDQDFIVAPSNMDDSAVIRPFSEDIVVTTDGHTIDPVFFEGGNIGDLAIAGTVNDLIVMGAKPLYLTISMIIEEGFLFSDLQQICTSLQHRLKETGVRVVAGDTKVMPKGSINGIVMVTAGFGKLIRSAPLRDDNLSPGDVIIVSGTVGDHGASLIARREGIELSTTLQSDVQPLWPDFEKIVSHKGVKSMKDVTRGGLATALNEFSSKSGIRIIINEEEIPINPQTKAICDILGLEPLEISSEGKVILGVNQEDAPGVLELLHQTEFGKFAKIIGFVEPGHGEVHVKTSIGGTRILDKPYGEPIPRVC